MESETSKKASRAEEREDEEEEENSRDIDALSRELESLEEDYAYPDFSAIFDALLEFRFVDALEEAGVWLVETLTYEISTSWVLVGELIGRDLICRRGLATFPPPSGSLPIGDSGFLIAYFITFTILFSNFTIMADLFARTVETLSKAPQNADSRVYAGSHLNRQSDSGRGSFTNTL